VDNNSGRNRFWRLISPLLIFFALNTLAQMIIATFVLAQSRMGEILEAIEGQRVTIENIRYIQSNLPPGDVAENARLIASYAPYILVFGGILTLIYSVLAFRKDRKEEVEAGLFTKKVPKIWQYSLIAGLGLAVCFGLSFLLIMLQMAIPGFRASQVAGAGGALSVVPFWFRLLGLGVVIAVAEEYIFRGLIFKRQRETNGFVRSMVMSSLIFAIIHSTTVQMIYAFALGILCAYVYEKFGSLIAPITLHVVTSITSLLLVETNGLLWFFQEPMRAGVAVVLAAFVGSSLFVVLRGVHISSEVIGEKGT